MFTTARLQANGQRLVLCPSTARHTLPPRRRGALRDPLQAHLRRTNVLNSREGPPVSHAWTLCCDLRSPVSQARIDDSRSRW